MQVNVPSDLETPINERLSSGAFANVEDVLRRALEAQDAEESCCRLTSRKGICRPSQAN